MKGVQIELLPRVTYGRGRVNRLCGARRRILPALGGPSWSRLCPQGSRVLAVPLVVRLGA